MPRKNIVYVTIMLLFIGSITFIVFGHEEGDPLLEDINRDGSIDIRDLVLVANAIGQPGARYSLQNPDANRDGIVNVLDLVRVATFIGETEQGDNSTYHHIQDTVFDQSCTNSGCHIPPSNASDLNLTYGQSYYDLVNRVPQNQAAAAAGLKLIDPGNPDNSFLLTKLLGPDNPSFGSIMPIGSQQLSEAKVITVREWISAGAPRIGFVETSENYIYWASWHGREIQRARLDGSNIQTIVNIGHNVHGVAIDRIRGKIYWTDKNTSDHFNPNAINRVARANLDGTNIEILYTENSTPGTKFSFFQIVVDPFGGKIYWTKPIYETSENTESLIMYADLDGTDVDSIDTKGAPSGLKLDSSNGKLYWTDCPLGKIQRANLDGTNIEDVITEIPCSLDLALDIQNERIYWVDVRTDAVHRANFDGSNPEVLVRGLSHPHGIVVDSLNDRIYWTDLNHRSIYRANLDGTNAEAIISGSVTPVYMGITVPFQ